MWISDSQTLWSWEHCQGPYRPLVYVDYFFLVSAILKMGLPWWLSGKESACQARDSVSTSGLGKSLGESNGNPPQYSGLGNSKYRGAWRATVYRIAKESDMT